MIHTSNLHLVDSSDYFFDNLFKNNDHTYTILILKGEL